jgi:hypothetical protein
MTALRDLCRVVAYLWRAWPVLLEAWADGIAADLNEKTGRRL